ncbi:hypothetical protein FRC01_004238, partial [Tulasnella sp. 417]
MHSTWRHARIFHFEENSSAPVEALSSQERPPSPSNTVRPLETYETNVPRELSVSYPSEPLDSSSQYEHEVPSEVLSTAGIAQARRRRLRAQTNRARRMAEDLADEGFSVANLATLGFAGPTESDGVAVESEDASGLDEAGPLSPAVPTSSIHLLHQMSSELAIESANETLPTTAQPVEPDDAFETETASSYKTARESQASSSSSHSPFEYDNLSSSPPSAVVRDLEPLNPSEDHDIVCERSVYNPANPSLSLPTVNTIDGSADNDRRSVEKEGGKIASLKAESLKTVAPSASTRVLYPENRGIVITLTAPSPPTTMKLSQGTQSVKDMAVESNDCCPVPCDLPPVASQQSDMLAGTRSAENYFPPLDVEADEDVRYEGRTSQRMAWFPPSNHYLSRMGMRSFERETDGLTRAVHTETPSTSSQAPTAQALGSYTTLVDGLSPTATLITLSTIGSGANEGQIVDIQDEMSAGGKAKPSPPDAPIYLTPVTRRRLRKVKKPAARPVPGSVRQQARTLKSSIVSSIRRWGNAASKVFIGQRPARVETNAAVNPYFDPWEGFVPSRGPSPDLTQTDDDATPAQSNIWNIYVNMDEL